MRVAILGPLAVTDDEGRPVDLNGPRLRTLVIRLALAGGRLVDSGTLIDAIWGDFPPAAANNALQTLVSRVRRILPAPAALTGEPTGYRLTGTRLDAEEFERLAATGRAALRAGDPSGAVEALGAALALCRGPALIDAAHADFARTAATRLTELRLAATEDRIEAELALGADAARPIGELTELTAGYPLRERPHELLMRALAGSGRGAEAVAVYARLRATLADELGADPSPELAELNRAILRGRSGEAARPGAARRPGEPDASRARSAGNLPVALTSFVGRDTDLARLDALLAEHRLVTLVGPGGAGKTRLATEAARAHAGRLPGGAWLVELAPVRLPDKVPQAVAESLRPHDAGLIETAGVRDVQEHLVELLSGREALLILDNCEHLVGACAELAERILGACPRVRVLATSREPLAITAEALCPVGPLATPPGPVGAGEALAFPAVRLLTDRAGAVRPGFTVGPDNVADVVEICRRLDGLPLAIELAAARLRNLPAAQVAARLGDRFRLLTGGSRTALPRHQTLLAVVEWSWDLLDEAERRLARGLSVFLDGATLDAVEEVCDGDLTTLGGLVDKSLVTLSDEDGRYRMLETIRDYAAARLAEAGEADTVRRSHASYFLVLAETAEPRLRTGEQLIWLERLKTERDNLVGALRWAIDSGEAEIALRLTSALGWNWVLRGQHAEAVDWLKQVVDLPGEVPAPVRDCAFLHLAMNLMATGDADSSREMYARLKDLDPNIHPLIPVGQVLSAVMEEDEQRVLAALPAALNHPDPWARGLGLAVRGWLRQQKGDPGAAERDLLQAQEIFVPLGDRWANTVVISSLAESRSMRGDHVGAIEAHRSAFALTQEMHTGEDDRAATLFQLIWERLRAGDLAGARDDLALAERLLRDSTATPLALLGLMRGDVARGGGDLALARAEYERCLEGLRGMSGMQPDAPLFALSGLVWVTAAQGDLPAAERYQREVASLCEGSSNRPLLARAAETLAGLLVARADFAGAVRALASAESLRGRPDLGSPDVAAVAEAARAALGTERYAAEYAAGLAEPIDIMPPDAAQPAGTPVPSAG
ncbi:BTAD domain-containing putative transcriptional regulator [Rugosimonospora africana]|uniref:SARP family transcriptional regulator n=1 Tax=Rugosimonospora africana TaxID=556532 RepID=A0A8J3QME9_9ACTN|nr:BTAD domain-containing putative transcriptional regulator [Rugosimonospora africana]GIH13653.1 SARP family transcriptional regulator [Rugosimonospora africana]